MTNIYYHIRLWVWWNFTIRKDEFSFCLDSYYIRNKYIAHITDTEDFNRILTSQRYLAHTLDEGTNIFDIHVNFIKNAKI